MDRQQRGRTDGGEAASPLEEQVELGERVAGSAALVGDQEDFHVWRSKRNAWVEGVTRVLLDGGQAVEVELFRRTVTVSRPRSGWNGALSEELRHVGEALAFLRTLTHGEQDALTGSDRV